MTNKTTVSRVSRAGTDYLTSLWDRREFAWYMAMGNLRSRNASTSLGLVWWVLNPLLMALVYWLVFGVILNVGASRDLSYLLSGIFVFYFTSTSVSTGANSIIQNTRLLVNLQFPRLIMPITGLIEASVGFLVSIPALYLIIGPITLLIDPEKAVWPTTQLLWILPLAFVIQVVFNLGMSASTARLAVPFRDINNLIPHLLRIWLYLSPILYSAERLSKLPEPWETIARLNPMVPILGVYRSALLGYPLEWSDVGLATVWALVVVSLAVLSFVRYEGRMARYL